MGKLQATDKNERNRIVITIYNALKSIDVPSTMNINIISLGMQISVPTVYNILKQHENENTE